MRAGNTNTATNTDAAANTDTAANANILPRLLLRQVVGGGEQVQDRVPRRQRRHLREDFFLQPLLSGGDVRPSTDACTDAFTNAITNAFTDAFTADPCQADADADPGPNAHQEARAGVPV